MKESIKEMLADAFDDAGNFDADAFSVAVKDVTNFNVDDYDAEESHALAAAIEYYDGDIEQARAAIDAGEYRHCPDAQTYEDLGWEVLKDTANVDRLPQLVLDYMDFEALGRDVSRDAERGKFTHFGYFAPERW